MAQDLKLAQYGHLAPRITFVMQFLGAAIGAVFNYIMMNSIVTNKRHILLSVEGTNIWSGQQVQQFNSLVRLLFRVPKKEPPYRLHQLTVD